MSKLSIKPFIFRGIGLITGLIFLYSCQSPIPKERAALEFETMATGQIKAVAADYELLLSNNRIQIQANENWDLVLPGTVRLNQISGEEPVYEDTQSGAAVRVYEKGEGHAAYDVILPAGKDISDVVFELEGAANPRLEDSGELILPVEGGELRHSAPYAYQHIEGVQREVESRFVLEGNQLGFALGEYEENYEVVIDPTITFVPAKSTSEMLAVTLDLDFEVATGTLPALDSDITGDGNDESILLPDVGGSGQSSVLPPFGIWGGGQGGYLVTDLDASSGSNFFYFEGVDNCLNTRGLHDLEANITYEICFDIAALDPDAALNTNLTNYLTVEAQNPNTGRYAIIGHPDNESVINGVYNTGSNTASDYAAGTANYFIPNSDMSVTTTTNDENNIEWKRVCMQYTTISADEFIYISAFGGTGGGIAIDNISCTEVVGPGVTGPVFNIDNVDGQTITLCDATFYDSGGQNGNYTDRNGGEHTVTFTAASGQMEVEFTSFHMENGFDFLEVYDGTDNTGTQLGNYTGDLSGSVPFTVTSTTGSLHFVSRSDFGVNEAGWEATIACSDGSSSDPVVSYACCSDNNLSNGGFESTFTPDEQFPNSTLSPSNNAESDNVTNWFYADQQNGSGITQIVDASKASEGDQFVYIRDYPSTPPGNQCIGTVLTYVSPGSIDCTAGEFTNGLRYIVSYDWVSFDRNNPDGVGAGATVPRLEDLTFAEVDLYDANGVDVSKNANTISDGVYVQGVDWANVSSSWDRAYGVFTPTGLTSDQSLYVSHASDATGGLLMDNVSMEMLSFSATGLGNVSCGTSNDQITFTLNPVSNVGGIPNLQYDVVAPAGFGVTPTTGVYGEETSFTVTAITDGDFSDGVPASVDITVRDQVNLSCSAVETLTNPCAISSCTNPSAISASAIPASCTDGAVDANTAYLLLSAYTDADRVNFVAGSDYSSGDTEYGNATPIGSLPFSLGAGFIPDPSGTQDYTIRLFNGDSDCYTDYTLTMSRTLPEIGNFVWLDSTFNGIQDPDEPGVAGMLVQLYTAGNVLIGQDTTDAMGEYNFNHLNVDTTGIAVDGSGVSTPNTGWTGLSYNTDYQIVFGAGQYNGGDGRFTIDSEEYGGFTLANAGGDDALDSDVEGATFFTFAGSKPRFYPEINMTTPASDCEDQSFDMGVLSGDNTYSLGNQVFHDADSSGHLNGAEVGIDGVVLQLLDFDSSVYDSDTSTTGIQPLTVTTANGGYYRFDNLPAGNYRVEVVPSNFTIGEALEGLISSKGPNEEITPNSDVDDNDNGIDSIATGEIRSRIVTLGNLEPTGETEPGSYGAGSTTGTAAVDAFSNLTVDFGFIGELMIDLPELGAIGNYVWVDENSDGFQDEGERGIPNVLVQLEDNEGSVIATTYTDASGHYLFPNLEAENYYVDIDDNTLPAGMSQTTTYTNEVDGSDTDEVNDDGDLGNKDHNEAGYRIVLDEGEENLTADFGYNFNPTTDVNGGTNTAALGDRVWIDSDGDGVQDPNEIGVEGVEITLTGAGADGIFGTGDDVSATTTTDENGYYLFDGLTPGVYTTEVTDDTGASHDVLNTSNYGQTGDPDHFAVSEADNPDDSVEDDNQQTTGIVLGPGDVYLNSDYGYQPTGASLGSIGNTVWFDADADGNGPADSDGLSDGSNGLGTQNDPSEAGISGVTVSLIQDSNGDGVWDAGEPIIATDITDENGAYLFEGLPLDDGDGDADYIVWVNDTENVLDGLENTFDEDGGAGTDATGVTNDASGVGGMSGVALNSGSPDDRNQDFGYTTEGHSSNDGYIGNYVWYDDRWE